MCFRDRCNVEAFGTQGSHYCKVTALVGEKAKWEIDGRLKWLQAFFVGKRSSSVAHRRAYIFDAKVWIRVEQIVLRCAFAELAD